jgi:hypothetical protein
MLLLIIALSVLGLIDGLAVRGAIGARASNVRNLR